MTSDATRDGETTEEAGADGTPRQAEHAEAAEPTTPQDSPAAGGRLRGRGRSTAGGGLTEQLRKRIEAAARGATDAAKAAAPQARELAAQVQDQVQRLASAAREEAQRQRPDAERAARNAGERAKNAVERTKPEIERLTREARAAGEAAGPQVTRAAKGVAQYAREHESELRSSAAQAARSVAPRPLRPAIDALGAELSKSAEQAAPEQSPEDRGTSTPEAGGETAP
jgi:hypothetical protein